MVQSIDLVTFALPRNLADLPARVIFIP